jgi:hypothetical protein
MRSRKRSGRSETTAERPVSVSQRGALLVSRPAHEGLGTGGSWRQEAFRGACSRPVVLVEGAQAAGLEQQGAPVILTEAPAIVGNWVVHLLVVRTSAAAAAATASSAIRRAVSGHPAWAARPISATRRPSGPVPFTDSSSFLAHLECPTVGDSLAPTHSQLSCSRWLRQSCADTPEASNRGVHNSVEILCRHTD